MAVITAGFETKIFQLQGWRTIQLCHYSTTKAKQHLYLINSDNINQVIIIQSLLSFKTSVILTFPLKSIWNPFKCS